MVRWIGCLTSAALLLFGAAIRAMPDLNQPAPALVVKEFSGKPFDLAAQHGHVVIVHLWATWCTPCRQEMPILNTFYQKFHAQGVELLALSVDDPHDLDAARAIMEQFSYPATLLASAQKNGFGRPRVIPMTYVFDSKGVLRARLWPGGTKVTEQNLETAVKPLLAPHASSYQQTATVSAG